MRLSQIGKMTLSAILLALAILMTFLAKLIPMGSFSFLRFSLTPSIVIFCSLACGPIYGAIVGAASDLIPAFTFSTGQYNFLLTIVYALLGILPWVLSKLFPLLKEGEQKKWPLYVVIGLIGVMYALVAVFFYATPYLNEAFGDAGVWLKPLILGLLALGVAALIVGILLFGKRDQKVSWSNLVLIATISEILLMLIGKSLAFWIFYSWIADIRFGATYWYFFSMLLVGTPINVLLIAGMNRLYFALGTRLLSVQGDNR